MNKLYVRSLNQTLETTVRPLENTIGFDLFWLANAGRVCILSLLYNSKTIYHHLFFTQTFSPENGDTNGAVNASFITSGEKKNIEKNGNEVERESDGEEERGLNAGNAFI